MIVYVETSAFVKLLLREPDSPLADAIWNAADGVISARLLYPELRAALAAAQRARRLSRSQLAATLPGLHRRFAQLDVVELSEPVALLAGEVAERYRLRAGDAVHLASALSIPAEVTVSTWDADLRRASLEAGLSVAP